MADAKDQYVDGIFGEDSAAEKINLSYCGHVDADSKRVAYEIADCCTTENEFWDEVNKQLKCSKWEVLSGDYCKFRCYNCATREVICEHFSISTLNPR